MCYCIFIQKNRDLCMLSNNLLCFYVFKIMTHYKLHREKRFSFKDFLLYEYEQILPSYFFSLKGFWKQSLIFVPSKFHIYFKFFPSKTSLIASYKVYTIKVIKTATISATWKPLFACAAFFLLDFALVVVVSLTVSRDKSNGSKWKDYIRNMKLNWLLLFTVMFKCES